MARPVLPRILVPLAAFVLALAPIAAASQGSLTAQTATFGEGATQDGRLVLASIVDSGDAGSGGHSIGSQPWLDIHAGSAQALHYTRSSYDTGDAFATTVVDPTQAPQRDETDLTDGRLQVSAVQPGFELHVYTLSGDLAFTGQAAAGSMRSNEHPALGPGGVDDASTTPGQAAGDHPDFFGFARVDPQRPLVLQTDVSPQVGFTVAGDFIVEVSGLTLMAHDSHTDATLASGRTAEPVAGTPPATQAAAYHVQEAFLRIYLHDASLEFANDGPAPQMVLAMARLDSQSNGPVTFTSAHGTLHAAGHDVTLDDQRYVLAGPSLLSISPQQGMLTVGVGDPSTVGTRGVIASVPAPASAALVGSGAILALAAAVGIGLLRRVVRLPALADVEAAIEEGNYRGAARMAGRILARLPGSEDALLGRAIALSKSGDSKRVVDEVSAHLAARPASDGSLHYVLGLAQLETGQDAEGKASLREAVRLTPSLQAEVAPRLGKAFSVAPTSTKETHGYA